MMAAVFEEYWPWKSQMVSGRVRFCGLEVSTYAKTNSFHKVTALKMATVHDPSAAQRQPDAQEGPIRPGTVDHRGLVEFARYLLHEPSQDDDRDGQREGDVGKDQRAEGVVEPHLANQDVDGDQR